MTAVVPKARPSPNAPPLLCGVEEEGSTPFPASHRNSAALPFNPWVSSPLDFEDPHPLLQLSLLLRDLGWGQG